jgi:T5SS/PEP-CTERM-associated repeat protein
MRFVISAILILLGFSQQVNAQDTNPIIKVDFNQLEASQYNIGENGVAWSSSSTLSNFFKLYTTGWKDGKFNTNKPENYYGPGADGILNYASNNAPPSIYGANGFLGIGSDTNANVQHLLDNHHRVSGLYLLTTIFTNGYSATVTVTNASGTVITTNIGAAPNYTYVNQITNWSHMSPTQFWSNMLAGEGGTNFAPVSTNANGFWSTTNQPTFLWAYNKGVLQIPTNTPPPMIPNLTDDTLRDVAAQVNYPDDYGFTLKGYQTREDAKQFNIQDNKGDGGKVLYYQEFWWANYLREYVYIPTISNRETAGMDSNAPYQFTDYKQLVAFSADFLCHSSNAAHLPGYYDPGLTSVDFPAFSQGSSVLIGTNGSLEVSGNMIIDQAATLTVKGTLSVTNETFYVGKVTSNNTLIISDGGVVTNNNAVIGSSAAATNNSALITGSGSTWFLYGDLIVGEFGSANSMTISNGGQVTNGLSTLGSVIGFGAGSTGNSVLVTGTNVSGVASLWTCVNDLTVGWSGSSNSLRITQGGGVTSYIGIIGDDTNARGNSAVVDGSGSYWSNSNVLLVGVSGSGNSLFITNGGQVMAVNSDIGVNAGSTANMVTVSGVGSAWTNSGDLTVGYGGSSNTLSVSEGAQLFSSSSYIGSDIGSTGNTVIVTGTASLWTNSGDLFVGNQGASNSLVISSGGKVINGGQDSTGGVIGYIDNSSNNSVVVTGIDSAWLSAGDVVIGYGGTGNRLEVSDGGTVSNGVVNYEGGLSGGIIGFNEGSTDNRVLVTGIGSRWISSGDLFVGFNGAGNSMLISNGGSIYNSQMNFGGVLGWGAGSSNNTVLVTDADSSWANSGNLTIGNAGSGNSMVISNGGTVAVASNSSIGNDSPSSNNSVLVTGAGSLWTNTGNLYVGNFGSGNSLVISNGGTVLNAMGYIGSASTATGNLVTVTGSNSSWINSGDLYVGYAGQSNRLVISNGGFVSNVNGFDDGVDPMDAYNSVLVTGAGSRWSNSGNLTFGLAGHDNSLVISNGGIVTVGVDSKIGDLATASNNSVLVTGPSSIWTNSGTLYVGNYGSGNSLVISNGGRVLNAGSSYISFRDISSNNSVHVTGSGSSLVSQFALGIGAFGAGNTLTISDGASVSNAYAAIGVGPLASNNSVLVTGSNSTWRSSDSLAIGGGGLYYPSGGSSWNSMTISNGASVYAGRGFIGSLDSSNNSVLVTEAGSLWSISTNLVVGYSNSSHNSLVISNGGRVNSSVADIGFAATSTGNSVLITGTGSTWSNSGNLTIGDAGSGTLTVANGGVLSASRILIGTNGDLDFGRYQQNDTAGNVVTTTIEFTGTNSDDYGINFNQSDTLHLTSSIIGAGWVCQLGTGTSVMSGSNSYSLYTKIDAGTLVAASTNALGTGYLEIGGYADRATLMLATNLTVGDFIWGSNGLVALTAGSQTLTVAGMTNSAGTNNGANVFRFLNMDLSNATNTLINYTSLAGFTTNSFSVSGISGYSFSTNGNQVSAYLSTSANVAVSNSVTINGTLTVNSLTVDPSGTLMGTGTLSLTGGNLTVNGTFAPGNSPGTFFVSGGNLLMGASSVWDQQIYSASVYDRVVVTGSAILNGTMNITTDGVTQLQFGQKYNFLTASGGISGAFSSIVAPEGFRGRLLLSGNNTQANMLIAPASYTQLAANRNQTNVATALNSFIPYTSGDQQVVSTSLDSLTASQYNQAFNAIMPTFYQQIATIAFNNANAQNMQLVQRLWGLRVAEGGGFSMSGLADNMPILEGQGDGKSVLDSKKDILRPGLDNHWGMFVDGNGIFAQANSGNMLPGYNAQSGGITAGLTYKWNENVGTGIYCGYQGTYTKSGADGSGLGTGSSLIDNAVRFGVFGTYGQKDGKGLFVNALAGGGYHNFQATRVIQYAGMNRTANSAPGAGELDTMLAAGYDIKKGKFTFGPTASLQYTYLGVNSLNETGAQSLSFNSGGWNSSSMLSSVGAHAAYSWVASKNILVVPQVNLSWQHEFMQNPYAISGNLGGTSPTFSNWSATPIRDFLYTGVGFTVEFAKKWNTSFFYNAAAGNSDLVSQNIFWSAGIKF